MLYFFMLKSTEHELYHAQLSTNFIMLINVKMPTTVFADVFDGLGLIPGKCKLHLDPNAVPVIRPSRRVPITIRDLLKKELDRMEKSASNCQSAHTY